VPAGAAEAAQFHGAKVLLARFKSALVYGSDENGWRK
jgi:hypothetical protein